MLPAIYKPLWILLFVFHLLYFIYARIITNKQTVLGAISMSTFQIGYAQVPNTPALGVGVQIKN